MIRKTALLLGLPLMLAVTACADDSQPVDQANASGAAEPAADNNFADAMRSNDRGDAGDMAAIPDSEPRPMMQAQVVLDRLGFSPGVIDGKDGISTKNALRAFQEANALDQNGTLDEPTKAAMTRWQNIEATRVVTIPEDFAVGRFEKIPDDPADQAKMTRLGYESLDEKLAERFHTTVDVLKMLNPGGKPATTAAAPGATASATPTPTPTATATPSPSGTPASGASTVAQPGPPSMFAAGQQIRVPNIGADFIDAKAEVEDDWRNTLQSLGIGTDQPKAARIVADKSASTLKVYDAADKLIAAFTITSGSSNDPLPLGEWKILGKAYNPPFAYDPTLFWDVADTEEKQQLPPGPNGPVGVVWIDLSKEHYGIHGTPHPETIGRAESHGCVRLTNWDAARLAQMVSGSTKVLFEA